MSFFNRSFFTKKRVQSVLIPTQDRRIVDTTLPVEKGYIVDHDTNMAWLIPSYLSQERKSGRFYLVITELDAVPIYFGKNGNNKGSKWGKEQVNKIAREEYYREIGGIAKDIKSQKMAMALRLMAMACVFVTLFLTIALMFLTGNFRMPDFL